MPVTINEVHSEIHAVDASALLSEEVLRLLTARVIEEIRRQELDQSRRDRDAKVADSRRVAG